MPEAQQQAAIDEGETLDANDTEELRGMDKVLHAMSQPDIGRQATFIRIHRFDQHSHTWNPQSHTFVPHTCM